MVGLWYCQNKKKKKKSWPVTIHMNIFRHHNTRSALIFYYIAEWWLHIGRCDRILNSATGFDADNKGCSWSS